MSKIKYLIFLIFVSILTTTINATEIEKATITKESIPEYTSFTLNSKKYYAKLYNDGYYIYQIDTLSAKNQLVISNYTVKSSNCLSLAEVSQATATNNTDFLKCSDLVKTFVYSNDTKNYLITLSTFKNNKLKETLQYLRNSNNLITEQRNYFYTDNSTKTIRYYGGKSLRRDMVSYNKTSITIKNSKNQVTSQSNYQLSTLWNEKKANVLVANNSYLYYANGNVKEKKVITRSVATNNLTSNKTYSYRSNKTIAKAKLITYFSKSNKVYTNTEYIYNNNGKLASNSKSKAVKTQRIYNSKNKLIKTNKYQYNSKGKAIKVK